MKPIDEQFARAFLMDVLHEAYAQPRSVSSNWARVNAGDLACAASMGLLTTRLSDGGFGRQWRPTLTALRLLGVK